MFTLHKIDLKTEQKSNRTGLRFYSTGEELFENVTFIRSETTTLSKRGRTKTERYAALCKHLRYQFSSIRPALWHIIEKGEYFMFWKALNDKFRRNFYKSMFSWLMAEDINI